MLTKSLIRLAALIQLAMLFACADYTAPNKIEDHSIGQFSLVSADEQALPATVFDGIITADPAPSFHLRVIATSGTFSIDASGHYTQHVEHDTVIDGVRNGRVIRGDHGDCTRTAAELRCVSSFLEGIEFTGVITGATIAIAQDLSGEGHLATYRYTWVAPATL